LPDLPLIDAHVHFWDPCRFRYPWLGDIPSLQRPFLPADYVAACGSMKVDAMVFVQCEAECAQAMDEARWVSALAQEEPRLRGLIPWAPLERGERSRAYLDDLTRLPLVKGVRRLIQSETDPDFCLRPDFIKGVQGLAGYGLSFDICISHDQLAGAIAMVRRCPAVTFILDHIAKPNIRNRLLEPWRRQIREMADLPNVVCKLSGMVTEADHAGWTGADLKPYIDHVVECFGFDRIMFGGDWPVVTLASTYPRWVEAFEWALAGCSEDEWKKVFRDNTERVYRLGRARNRTFEKKDPHEIEG